MSQCQLLQLPKFTLCSGLGSYKNFDEGEVACCIMAAAVACWRLKNGEPLGEATASLECCCPIVGSFLINFNDASFWKDDNQRTMVLSSFIERLAGTRNDNLIYERAFIIADWAIRVIPPALDAIGLNDEATQLRNLPQVRDDVTFPATCRTIRHITQIVFDKANSSSASDIWAVTNAILFVEIVVSDLESAANNIGWLGWSDWSCWPAQVITQTFYVTAQQDAIIQSAVAVIDRLIRLSE